MSRYIDADNLEHKIILHRRIAIHKDDILSIIADIPTAEVSEIVHGKWIDTPLDRYKKLESKCSICGWTGVSNYDSYVDVYDFCFCPHCGADMRDEEGRDEN